MNAARPQPLWRALLWPGLFTGLALLLLLSLGFWQLQRLAWKDALLARIAQRIDAAPAPLPAQTQWRELAHPDNEYLRVQLSGVFDHSKEMLIFRAAGSHGPGAGFHVITPLRITLDGERPAHVLVNRGFVPQTLGDPAKRAAGQISGVVEVSGHVRSAETRTLFTPADTPDKGVWYTRDPVAMAAFVKLENTAPFVIDADSASGPGEWPKHGAARVRIPNNHLSYALTWFGLALTLIAVFAAFAWRKRQD